MRRITIFKDVTCDICFGRGKVIDLENGFTASVGTCAPPWEHVDCPTCKGTGKVTVESGYFDLDEAKEGS